VTAHSSEEAVAALAHQSINLLVADRLPVDGPHDLAQWLECHPDLRVLGTTESATRALSRVRTSHRLAVVVRPLAADQVAEAVRALLEATTDGPAGGVRDGDGEAPGTPVTLDDEQPIPPLEAS
jgi:hypothetical protein